MRVNEAKQRNRVKSENSHLCFLNEHIGRYSKGNNNKFISKFQTVCWFNVKHLVLHYRHTFELAL